MESPLVGLAAQEGRDFQLVVVVMAGRCRRCAAVVVKLATTRCVEAGFRRKRRAALLRRHARRIHHVGRNFFFFATTKRVGDALQETHRATLFLGSRSGMGAMFHLGLDDRREVFDLRHANRLGLAGNRCSS